MSRADELKSYIIESLKQGETELKKQWDSPKGTKTKYFFLDQIMPLEVIEELYSAFPKDGNGFFSRKSFREQKRTSAHLSKYNSILADCTFAFQDPEVINVISNIVGMSEIEPDPLLYAGGLSMMFKNDFLNPHIDNSHDSTREKYRRLNILFYVSPDWTLENGGNLELWNDNQTESIEIVSKANRLIAMETNKKSWHSVSKVVAESPRCCVSNYYFSMASPNKREYFHVTSFTGRPGEYVKRFISYTDNFLRNSVSKTLGFGRGKSQVNK
ncbi:MAG: 2OG-Fe(II) oxygenase [Bacteriovoracaceae bacterium]|jgi:hypothetical protein|nr:2OG-Fe(II) oxygenase [Bacteriovoracaceae bacterium]